MANELFTVTDGSLIVNDNPIIILDDDPIVDFWLQEPYASIQSNLAVVAIDEATIYWFPAGDQIPTDEDDTSFNLAIDDYLAELDILIVIGLMDVRINSGLESTELNGTMLVGSASELGLK